MGSFPSQFKLTEDRMSNYVKKFETHFTTT